MPSRAEELLSRHLRSVLADLPIGALIDASPEFHQTVLAGLEYFLPGVLGELYPEWLGDSLDGFVPMIMKKTGDDEFELFGLAILIGDQTLVPIHVLLQLDTSGDEVSWMALKIGEKLTGQPSETGKRGMRREPYSSLDLAFRRIYRLDRNADLIDWRYKVTFGERRANNNSCP